MKNYLLILFAVAVLLILGCDNDQQIKLVTTTTVQDSGFSDALKAKFESKTGISLLVIARGSGEALELGRRGDADLLLTHSPDDEEKFIANGFGTSREFVMANDFVLVGPPEARKTFSGIINIAKAFEIISNTSIPFVSRGDNSGTEIQEQKFWNSISRKPGGDWYLKSGSGMGTTLRIANEKRACTLCDRSTFLAMKKTIDLEILFEPQPRFQNEYHLIVVKGSTRSNSKIKRFRKFLFSEETQNWIKTFGIEKYGQAFFQTK